MIGDRDVESLVRRHLAAEAEELPFLVDGEIVRRRLAQRSRTPWRFLGLVPIAAAAVLAVLVGQALLEGRAPGPGASRAWGPLAVVSQTGGDEALNTGTLRITETCVVLETAGGESELLVWPADRTRWDASAGTIGFTNADGIGLSLHDRQLVSLGGGGDGTAESGVSGEEWMARVDWVAPPDLSCPLEIRWWVNDVVSPTPAASQEHEVGQSPPRAGNDPTTSPSPDHDELAARPLVCHRWSRPSVLSTNHTRSRTRSGLRSGTARSIPYSVPPSSTSRITRGKATGGTP
jgi:hypothetical protein